jgi:hypothetical protein
LGQSLRPAVFLGSQPATAPIVWSGSKDYDDPTDAIAREKELKKLRRDWKIRLIEELNPDGAISTWPFADDVSRETPPAIRRTSHVAP